MQQAACRALLRRQAVADVRHTGQHLALHEMAHADVERVALAQVYGREVETVLVSCHATAQDIALVVVKATVDGVGVEPVARFDNALDYEAQGGERVCACGAQTYSLAVTSAEAQPRYVESNRVVTLPPFHRC